MNERHAYVAIGVGRVFDHERGVFTSKPAFLDYYINPTFETGRVRNGEAEMESIGATWWRWPGRDSYVGVDFLPPGGPEKLPPDVLNTWRGWGVEPAETSEGCGRLVEHVHAVICKGDDDLFEWVMTWMAHMIQRPWEKPETAVVMRSDEGSGKGFLGRALVDLAGQHGLHVTQPKQLTGNFNSHLTSNVFVFADEVTWGGRRQEEGILKGLITEPNVMIEPKGVDAYRSRSCSRVMIASNGDWVVPAGTGARRFLVLDVGEDRIRDLRYFRKLQRELDCGGLAALHRKLLEWDLTNPSTPNVRLAPETRALTDQKIHGLDPIDRWLMKCLMEGRVSEFVEWPEEAEWISSDEIYQSFLNANREFGGTHRAASIVVSGRLRKIFDGMKRERTLIEGVQTRRSRIPGLQEARGAFERRMRGEIEWE
jgi:hypothetical protein